MTKDELRALYEDILDERARIKAKRRTQAPATTTGSESRSESRDAPVAASSH